MLPAVILLVVLLAIVGCQPRRLDFMTRVREDCAAGGQWACDLLDSLRYPKPIPPISSPLPKTAAKH